MKPSFTDHLSFIVKDIKKTEDFYSKFLEVPIYKTEGLIVYKVGDTRLFFKQLSGGVEAEYFDKDNVGVNHLAFGVRTVDELKELKEHLIKAGIKHSEIKLGRFGNEYIWFDDPDGIRLEVFHRPIEQ